MSLTNQIRDALKNAAGPMTASEIGEACEASSKDVQGALAPMVKRGEVASDGQGQSRTFTLDASYRRARAPAGERLARVAKAVAERRSPAAKRAPRAVVATETPAAAANDAELVTVPRRALRLLAAAVLASNADLGEHIREAAIEAVKAA